MTTTEKLYADIRESLSLILNVECPEAALRVLTSLDDAVANNWDDEDWGSVDPGKPALEVMRRLEEIADEQDETGDDTLCVYCQEAPADTHYDRCYDCRTWRDEEWCEARNVEHSSDEARTLANTEMENKNV